MRFPVALSLVALLLVLPACEKQSTSSGNAPAPGAGAASPGDYTTKSVTIKSEAGNLEMGQGAVDPASIGLPVYPGAEPSVGGSLATSNKEGSSKILVLTTKDPFDKVYAFYKQNMPAGSELAHAAVGPHMATFQVGKDGDKVVKRLNVQQLGDKINITMIVGTKN